MCNNNDNHLVENYGDTHLHYDGYPDYNGFYSNQCKWDGNSYTPGSLYIPDEPLYPQRCHTEYCHPGTWQGTDGSKCGKTVPTHIYPATGAEGFIGGFQFDTLPGLLITIALIWYLMKGKFQI